MKKLILMVSAAFLFCCFTLAQTTARNTVIFDSGDLVVSTTGRLSDGELSKADVPYAENIIGVFNSTTATRLVPSILETGIAYIKFDPDSGDVVKGDYITSSSKAGYGMKAHHSGFVAGVALEDSRVSRGLLKIRLQVGWVK